RYRQGRQTTDISSVRNNNLTWRGEAPRIIYFGGQKREITVALLDSFPLETRARNSWVSLTSISQISDGGEKKKKGTEEERGKTSRGEKRLSSAGFRCARKRGYPGLNEWRRKSRADVREATVVEREREKEAEREKEREG
ncbi:hypothetical protein ALC56_12767, partial [Trachymyrmex septentrionalis]